MKRYYKWLPPAEEVGEDFSYCCKTIVSPVLSGWKLKAVLFILNSPLSTVMRSVLYRRSGTLEVRWYELMYVGNGLHRMLQ